MTALALVYGVLVGATFIALLRAFQGQRLWPAPPGAHRRQRTVEVAAGAPVLEPVGFFDDGEVTVITPLGLIRQGFKYCPTEMRTVAMTLHPDGAASCDTTGCRTHIHATTTGDQ